MRMIKDILAFFNVKKAEDIKWAHAVNNRERLKNFCSNDIMMIEGDISLSDNDEIIMAHPPRKNSDLTFDEWITTLSKTHKGAKLDFKDPKEVIPVLKKLQLMKISMPIFLNADVLKGPGGDEPKFNPLEFINECEEFYPHADFLSLGWTVGYDPAGKYTLESVEEMIDLSNKSSIPVTLSVLAYYMPNSWDILKEIFEKSDATITIWSIKEVPISEELKRWIKEHVDPNKTFIDLIDENGSPIFL